MDNLEAVLVELRTGYATRLPAMMAELVTLVANSRANVDGAAMKARTLAHKLHGTAGSYGFGPIGFAAGRIEHAMERVIHAAGEPPAGTWEEIDGAVDEALFEVAQIDASGR